MVDSNIHWKLFDWTWKSDSYRVQQLLEAGAKPDKFKNSDGETALIRAARNTLDEVASNFSVKNLLKHGADINRQDNCGLTALHLAAINGHNTVTATLISAGADLNIQDNNGATPLWRAADRGRKKIASNLLQHGADPYLPNNEGKTPIQAAKNEEIARLE